MFLLLALCETCFWFGCAGSPTCMYGATSKVALIDHSQCVGLQHSSIAVMWACAPMCIMRGAVIFCLEEACAKMHTRINVVMTDLGLCVITYPKVRFELMRMHLTISLFREQG